MVKQTGGWITSKSEPGKGTSFDLYFPQVETPTGEVVAESAARKVSASAISGTETILLVEDQEGIRELAREYLRQKGYTVLDAADGNEGLQVAAEYKNPIHLLLTDVVMPNVGGQELAKRLAQERGQVKVLFMSGYPDHATWDADLPDDSAAVLQKPFTLESLARKIRALLDE